LPEPVEDDEAAPDRLTDWKSLTAFISRLVNSGYTQLVYLATWEIYDALESPPTKVKALQDCRVWAATEWISQCSQVLMNEMQPHEGDGEDLRKSEAAGPLFRKELPARSLQRWEFWKKRLAEMANEAEELGIETDTKLRIEKALQVMGSTRS
jgi:hypothetical protein